MTRAWRALTRLRGAVAAEPPKGALQRLLVPLRMRLRAWLLRAVAAEPPKGALQRLLVPLPMRLRAWLPSALPFSKWRPKRPSTVAAGPPDYLRLVLSYLRRVLRAAAVAAAVVVIAVLALVVAYRWINPPISTLMLGQSIAGTAIERTWVPLERVSPHLIKAVVLSEDGGFCGHSGVDLRALQDAIAHDRGGSTITMQVVKNLFLWPSRSYVRKAIEIGLAFLVDSFWPKRRVLEIYLNIAEWGDGVFGAEAAAQLHFGKSAARLTPEEAALMAVALPSPIDRTPGLPSVGTHRLAGRLLLRMAASRADLTCVRRAPRPQSASQARSQTQAVPKPPAQKGEWNYLFPGID
jgi:monofunctional biosynthetic peptidoglycan transglycosylase